MEVGLEGDAPNAISEVGTETVSHAEVALAAPSSATPLPDRWTDTLLNLNVEDYIWRQRRKVLTHLSVFILLPTLISALYVGWYATPRFVSEFQILYHNNQKGAALAGAASGGLLSSIIGSSSTVDMTRVISSYLTSKAIIADIDPQVGVKSMFSRDGIDWLDKLPANAPADKVQDYFKKRVGVYEENGGFIRVEVEAFSPLDAQKLAGALTQSVEKMVSEMYDRPKLDTVEFARKEMQRSETELNDATDAVTRFRELHADYDFSKSVGLLSGVVGGLQTQLADALSAAPSAKTLMGGNAPQVAVLNARIDALRGQIQAEREKLASSRPKEGATANAPYSEVMAGYERLLHAQDFARTLLMSSRQAYEAAREDAARKDAYIVSFVPPNLPDRSTAPQLSTYVWTTFFASLTAYAVGSIMIGLVRDQTGT